MEEFVYKKYEIFLFKEEITDQYICINKNNMEGLVSKMNSKKINILNGRDMQLDIKIDLIYENSDVMESSNIKKGNNVNDKDNDEKEKHKDEEKEYLVNSKEFDVKGIVNQENLNDLPNKESKIITNQLLKFWKNSPDDNLYFPIYCKSYTYRNPISSMEIYGISRWAELYGWLFIEYESEKKQKIKLVHDFRNIQSIKQKIIEKNNNNFQYSIKIETYDFKKKFYLESIKDLEKWVNSLNQLKYLISTVSLKSIYQNNEIKIFRLLTILNSIQNTILKLKNKKLTNKNLSHFFIESEQINKPMNKNVTGNENKSSNDDVGNIADSINKKKRIKWNNLIDHLKIWKIRILVQILKLDKNIINLNFFEIENIGLVWNISNKNNFLKVKKYEWVIILENEIKKNQKLIHCKKINNQNETGYLSQNDLFIIQRKQLNQSITIDFSELFDKMPHKKMSKQKLKKKPMVFYRSNLLFLKSNLLNSKWVEGWIELNGNKLRIYSNKSEKKKQKKTIHKFKVKNFVINEKIDMNNYPLITSYNVINQEFFFEIKFLNQNDKSLLFYSINKENKDNWINYFSILKQFQQFETLVLQKDYNVNNRIENINNLLNYLNNLIQNLNNKRKSQINKFHSYLEKISQYANQLVLLDKKLQLTQKKIVRSIKYRKKILSRLLYLNNNKEGHEKGNKKKNNGNNNAKGKMSGENVCGKGKGGGNSNEGGNDKDTDNEKVKKQKVYLINPYIEENKIIINSKEWLDIIENFKMDNMVMVKKNNLEYLLPNNILVIVTEAEPEIFLEKHLKKKKSKLNSFKNKKALKFSKKSSDRKTQSQDLIKCQLLHNKLQLLKKLFQQDYNWDFTKIVISTINSADMNILAKSFVHLFEYFDNSLEFFKFLIKNEVDNTEFESTLFRGNSITSKVMSIFAKTICSDFIVKSLRPTITEIINCKYSLEINPDKFNIQNQNQNQNQNQSQNENENNNDNDNDNVEQETLEINQQMLVSFAKKIFNEIINSMKYLPLIIRDLCWQLSEITKKKFPNSKYIVLAGFIFLRLLCPAILLPDQYGICDKPPNRSDRKKLISISKIIQNIANQALLKEKFMKELNFVIESNIPVMKNVMDDLLKPCFSCLNKNNEHLIIIGKADEQHFLGFKDKVKFANHILIPLKQLNTNTINLNLKYEKFQVNDQQIFFHLEKIFKLFLIPQYSEKLLDNLKEHSDLSTVIKEILKKN